MHKKKINLEERLVSYKILNYILNHSWAAFLLVAANIGLSFMINGYRYISDILWIAAGAVILAITELFLLLVASIAETSAELLCDVIYPRYDYVPPELYKVYQDENYRTSEEKNSPEARLCSDAEPSAYTNTNRQPADVPSPKEPSWTWLPPMVAWYCQSQQERGLDVTDIEARYVWYLGTLVLAVYGGESCQTDNFVESALQYMPEGYEELMEDVSLERVYNEYTSLTDALGEMEDEFNQLEEKELFEYIYSVELFMNAFERRDEQTKSLLCHCLETILEQTDEPA